LIATEQAGVGPGPERKTILQQRWLAIVCAQISNLNLITFLMLAWLSKGRGWTFIFHQLETLVPAYIFGFVVGAFILKRVGHKSRDENFRFNGVMLKVTAILNALFALGMSTLAAEPRSLSSWTPAPEEVWRAWIVIAWFWIVAAMSYLVGDAQSRLTRLDFQKKP